MNWIFYSFINFIKLYKFLWIFGLESKKDINKNKKVF